MKTITTLVFAALCVAAHAQDNLKHSNLVAWCIVPFDASKRGPEARAKMLKEIGIVHCAYDWRSQHVKEFEEEILQYQKHGIEFFAFWAGHEEAYRLFEKYDIRPQVWRTLASPKADSQAAKIQAAANSMEATAKRTGEVGCKFGLYNHGGWGGEPANLVAVCQELRRRGHKHVGIVYNWHHGHGHIDDWAESLRLLKPYLLCLNLNGMNTGAQPKILPLGQGEHDLAMLKVLA
ncbi:MAG: heme-binding domain-containing protein, partial [Limisphaerales bacterium]